MFWGFNWPFIEVGHFENTIVIDLEILTEIKIKLNADSQYLVYFYAGPHFGIFDHVDCCLSQKYL